MLENLFSAVDVVVIENSWGVRGGGGGDRVFISF